MTAVGAAVVALLGLAAGGLAGLFGVGGGVLMVPGMVLVLGFGQHLAQGTSLLVIIPTAIIGTYTHWRNGYVDLRRSAVLATGGILGAVIGGSIALGVDGVTLRRIFVAYLALMGIGMLLPKGTSVRALLTGSWRRGGRKAPAADVDVEPSGPLEGEP